mgnify:CR=1 FL=1
MFQGDAGELGVVVPEAVVDAALGGLPGAAGKLLGPAVGASEEGVKNFLSTGPLSTAAKSIGKSIKFRNKNITRVTGMEIF